MNLFTKTCIGCGGFVFGPRVGGRARGEWLGHERCLDCRTSALAGEAGTAATVKQGAVHEHATAQPERPNPTPILPKKERTK